MTTTIEKGQPLKGTTTSNYDYLKKSSIIKFDVTHKINHQ